MEAKERRRQNSVFDESVPTEKIISRPLSGTGKAQTQESVLFMTPARNCKEIRTLVRRYGALHGDVKL